MGDELRRQEFFNQISKIKNKKRKEQHSGSSGKKFIEKNLELAMVWETYH